MAPSIRLAQLQDLDALLALMQCLYEEDGIASFRPEVQRRTARELLDAPDAGRIYVAEVQDAVVGYAVLTWCHSLEFGGRHGLLDELYVLPGHRGHGLGKAFTAQLEAACLEQGVRVLRLEVEATNDAAQRFYHGQGFRQERRHLFTRWLDR